MAAWCASRGPVIASSPISYELPVDLESAIAAFVRLLQLPALSHGAGQRDAR